MVIYIEHRSSGKLELNDSCCLLWIFFSSSPILLSGTPGAGGEGFNFSKCTLWECYLVFRINANLVCLQTALLIGTQI